MARLEGGREGWGAVDHPETGELIQLDESHPKDVAETVASAYDWLEVVSSGDNSGGSSGENTCAGNNGECSRSVSAEERYCWQHRPE